MIEALALGYVFSGKICNVFEVGGDLIIKLQNFQEPVFKDSD